MKRTVEIEDTLSERVESACDDVRAELENYLHDNPDTDELPDSATRSATKSKSRNLNP